MYNRNVYYQMTDTKQADSDYNYGTERTLTEGNTVKRYDNAPEYEDDDCSEIQRQIRQTRIREKAREERARQSRLRRLEQSKGINLVSCILLSAVVLVMLYLCVDYISIKADVTSKSKTIAEKKNELNKLKSKNNSLEKEVEASVNLQEIYKVATKELGMVFANNNQVVPYSKSESAYVRQYDNMPEQAADNVFDDVLSAVD